MSDISNIPCARCGGPCIEFTAPNYIWNAVVRNGGPETDKEYLCVQCFVDDLVPYLTDYHILLDELGRFIAIQNKWFANGLNAGRAGDTVGYKLGQRVREKLQELR